MKQTMIDITGADIVEVRINHNGKILWVNYARMTDPADPESDAEVFCALRIQDIDECVVIDEREKRKEKGEGEEEVFTAQTDHSKKCWEQFKREQKTDDKI